MQQKKKILICAHGMNIGGAERSLLDMLHCLDYDRVQVELFLYRHEGEWMDQIPAQVKLLAQIPQYACLAIPMKDVLKKGQLGILLGRLTGKIKANSYEKKHNIVESAVAIEYSHKYTGRFMPPIRSDTEYDLAISFLTPHYFVMDKVRAKKKIAWIHTDYTSIAVDAESELKMWEKYDTIVSISDKCTESFLKIFPSLKDKIILIENVLAEGLVRLRADRDVSEEMPSIPGQVRILSIGRYSYQKNFDQVPEICAMLRDMGCGVKWYLIGYGNAEDIEKNRKLFHVEDSVILLGKKENPYPYIKACDVYIQPSRYEGKAVTVREAQMLHKPVIITAFATAPSQLENNVDGIIVPMDNKGCAQGIRDILGNQELLDGLVRATRERDYSNKEGLNRLYTIME